MPVPDRPPFPDYFSAEAPRYARHRPRYPAALFGFLADVVPARDAVWDCATGNGQAAIGLAEYFAHVTATDASTSQLTHAVPHPRISYMEAPAEASGLPGASFDLVTVATAAHWLDLERFYAEARRVLKPNGVIAVWSYFASHVSPEVDSVVQRYADEVLAGYWTPHHGHVHDEYRNLPFPFEEIAAPAFTVEVVWTAEEALAYLRTWSPAQRYLAERGEDPAEVVRTQLVAAWGEAVERPVRWPLFMRVGWVHDGEELTPPTAHPPDTPPASPPG